MTALPRAQGSPDPEAAAIIEQIHAYARRVHSPDPEQTIARVRSAHHIYDAASDALRIAVALAGGRGQGHVGHRGLAVEFDLAKGTMIKYSREGRALLKGETTR